MATEPDSEFAPAKVNLTLHVTGRRADGYHLLDSLVVFAGVGDRVTATPAAETSLAITGPQQYESVVAAVRLSLPESIVDEEVRGQGAARRLIDRRADQEGQNLLLRRV